MKNTLLLFLIMGLLQDIKAQAGTLDSTFGTGGIVKTAFSTNCVSSGAQSVALQADGKIVMAGGYESGSVAYFALARYKANGALDSTFGNNGKVTTPFSSQAYGLAVAIQADGKIVVAGWAFNSSVSGNTKFALARYNVNGSLDITFGSSGTLTLILGALSQAYSLIIQPDGKILVAGRSENGTGTGKFELIRLNSNGGADVTFKNSSTLVGIGYDYGNAIALQTDGKIVVAGESSSTTYTDFSLLRYKSDGNLDSSFGANGIVITDIAGTDKGKSVAIQADGKILVAGYSDGSFALVRYNTNGTLDNTFGTSGIAIKYIGSNNSYGRSVVIQSDGKILVGGYTYNDVAYYSSFALVRFNSNGGIDNTFGTAGVATTSIGTREDFGNSLALQPDGKILLAGTSTYISGFTCSDFALVRYNGGDGVSPSAITTLLKDGGMQLYPNPATNQLFIETNGTPVEQINIYNTTGSLVMSVSPSAIKCELSTGTLAAGVYVAEIKTNDASVKRRWVKM